ncbi:unnamed protein product [Bursaphelenchus okinawaensis]|uniref:CBF1-interacting co-repressor CIR N-terminal domain-containing protein n=1 Tax=Bursaphelenchus okinawaensis TaxID=465554 RepID=A0A811JSB6_9BILA|nr:unnamed protein product [Bursaphelenchus okinawaensis]CAG9080333.1 unnamed protein product [Bursaphelenchus okinawaensis]
MSKKDFHPSAWWNLKRKWEAEQKHDMEQKRQEELKIQYEREQEMLNNKALLGDEKARLGLSFMYDAPAGMVKKEEEKKEPKFEWQRKYNAPREEWAKDNDLIQDQPFGIQVRNVRCVRCKTWGHLNTDRECPLYGYSGNAEDKGYSNNPSELIKSLREDKDKPEKKEDNDEWEEAKPSTSKHYHEDAKDVKPRLSDSGSDSEDEKREPVTQKELLENMREEHNLKFKTNVLNRLTTEQSIMNMGEKKEPNNIDEFLSGLSEKKKKKLMKKILGGKVKKEKKEKKDKKKKKHHKHKKSRRHDSDSD